MISYFMYLFKRFKRKPVRPTLPTTHDFRNSDKFSTGLYGISHDFGETYNIYGFCPGIKKGDFIIIKTGYDSHGKFEVKEIEYEGNNVFFCSIVRPSEEIQFEGV